LYLQTWKMNVSVVSIAICALIVMSLDVSYGSTELHNVISVRSGDTCSDHNCKECLIQGPDGGCYGYIDNGCTDDCAKDAKECEEYNGVDCSGYQKSLEGCAMSYMSKCEVYKRDLQTGKLMSDNLIEEIEHVNSIQVCQEICRDIYNERCTWFMFDRLNDECKIFSGPVISFKEHCDEKVYLNGTSIEECDGVFEPESQNGCYNFREDYCRYDNSLIQNAEDVDTVVKCQNVCEVTFNCTYFQFNKRDKICKLHTNLASDRKCDMIHGTPEPSFQTCLDNGKVPWLLEEPTMDMTTAAGQIAPAAKECFELDTEYIENDLNGCWSMNNVKTNTAEQCQDLCVQVEGCHGFSWKSPNFNFYEPRLKLECCLKNGIAANNTKAYDGIVSGPKICGE